MNTMPLRRPADSLVLYRRKRGRGLWQEYERRKRALSLGLTPAQHEEAVRRICEELGL